MKKPADLLLAQLHERVMKPAGFRKAGNTFSRIHKDYGEHFNIQGSAWNASSPSWRFYINCAISFPGVPLRSAGTGLWKYHAHTRLAHLCSEAPSQFDVSDENRDEMVDFVGRLLMNCADYFNRRHPTLRKSYLNEDYASGFLRDPELIRDQQTPSPLANQGSFGDSPAQSKFDLQLEADRLALELGKELAEERHRGNITEETIAKAVGEHRQSHPYCP